MRFIFLFFFFITLIVNSYSQNAKPIVFERAFSGDTSYIDPAIPFNFYLKTFGHIKIESGTLIVYHTEMKDAWLELSEKFPTGLFPVQVAIAKELDNMVVAYSRILFSNEQVVNWEKASKKENTGSLSNCQLIDSDRGIGIFIDSITNKLANSKAQKKSTEAFINKLKADDNFFGTIRNIKSHSFAVFSGAVSVCFSVYIGYDAKGNICRLLADTHRIALPPSFY